MRKTPMGTPHGPLDEEGVAIQLAKFAKDCDEREILPGPPEVAAIEAAQKKAAADQPAAGPDPGGDRGPQSSLATGAMETTTRMCSTGSGLSTALGPTPRSTYQPPRARPPGVHGDEHRHPQ